METQAFIESVEYQTRRLCDKLAELDEGRRKIIVDGEDVSTAEADELRHRVTENLTIISRLRAGAAKRANVEMRARVSVAE